MTDAVDGNVLPSCAYRGPRRGGRYPCAAQQGHPVAAADCAVCPIPEAINHDHACLYLVPLRHEGRARFVCRWFFDWGNVPAPEDWRMLCFCRYWFPRPPREALIRDLGERRARYLRVLRGEQPRMPERPARRAGEAAARQGKRSRPGIRLRRWLARRLPLSR